MLRPLTIVLAAAAGMAWARRGGVRHVVVEGRSMAPTLLPGDRLVLVATRGPLRVGQLALAADPRAPDRELLKRVHAIGPGGVDLRGDDPHASTDSRTFGPVPADTVRAYGAWRYAPGDRAGRVPAGT